MKLQGKTAVVTGGSRGLGRRIAEAFLAQGARVVLAARSAEPAKDLLEAAGDRAVFQAVDVRDAASAEELMATAARHFGGLDIVVANAGVSRPGPVAGLSPEDWRETVSTNLDGTFHCVRAAVPYLERSRAGRLITLSSALATRVTPGASAYCATKAAVETFTRVSAVELAPRGITVNCLCPGFIDEGMGKELAANEVVWGKYAPKVSLGRMGRPEEVAEAAVFLAGEDSGYINGHVLEVNGGLSW
ncbi:SDR family NAD(P)-dependent oxidoreductase [Streptomyces sp. I05A-00742]|uniref:SDR family oxidoreductase n=1 Tax=Streptomyces sp. I05A-00742 TaxID=2732853 RepID=UPI0014876C0C|nr:SDR family NAD(P)-dependent oxidoreductase [Streptomyces sp. I05A-00742]